MVEGVIVKTSKLPVDFHAIVVCVRDSVSFNLDAIGYAFVAGVAVVTSDVSRRVAIRQSG